MQRQPALEVPLRARDLGSVQPARHSHLDPLRAKPLRVLDRPPHRTAKRDSFLELLRDLFGLKLCVQLGLVDLLYIYVDLAAGSLFDLALELVDLRALSADDDSRPRSVDDDLELVGRSLDVDVRDTGAG